MRLPCIEKWEHRNEKPYVWAVPIDTFGRLYQQEQWSGLKIIVIIAHSPPSLA